MKGLHLEVFNQPDNFAFYSPLIKCSANGVGIAYLFFRDLVYNIII